jgi:two-component system response regulator FixJ
MANEAPTVFIVDDDDGVRDSIRALLESADHLVQDFAAPRLFLAAYRPEWKGCLVADLRMPDMDGLELQHEMTRRKISLPVIIVTGHGDVPLAVRAMRAGALDFIEKPFEDDVLLASVDRAFQIGDQARMQNPDARAMQEKLAHLTPRENEVLMQLVAGHPNKVIAYKLSISPRTVEVHRANVMEKMQARSVSDLVRMALSAGIGTAET